MSADRVAALAEVLRTIEGRVLCDATAAECRCVKDAGHVEAGDDVHACDPRQCTGEWAGTWDDSRLDGGPDFHVVALPYPVRENEVVFP